MQPYFHSRPYEFGGGILFSFQHEGRIRDAFVPPDLLSETGQTSPFREVLDYVERHPGPFIDAARRMAETSKPPELLMLDRWVFEF